MKEWNDRNGERKSEERTGRRRGSEEGIWQLWARQKEGWEGCERRSLTQSQSGLSGAVRIAPGGGASGAMQQATDAGWGSLNVVGYRCPIIKGRGRGGGVCHAGSGRACVNMELSDGQMGLGLYGTCVEGDLR